MSENQFDNPSTQKGKKVSLPLLLLFLLSLALNAYLFYDWYQNNYSDGKSLTEINAELLEVLAETEFSKDSLQKEYDLLSEQYQSIYDESEMLRIERTDALEDLGQKKVRIRQLLSQANTNPRKLVEANGQIEQLKRDLNDYRIKLDIAIEDKEKYETEITAYQSYGEEMEKQKKAVEDINEDLETRLDDATFHISDLVVKPLRQRRKGMEETNKSAKVQEIEISFTVLESPMIKEGEKELALRIIGTNKEVLGADNDLLADSDKLVSMKKDFTYDGKSQKFKFKFKQEEAYKKGSHYAEIWSEGKMIIRSPFNLE